MTVNFGGNVYDDAGNAVSGASVKLLETGTTTQEGSTVTTDSDGRWDFLEADQDRYDVEITKGSSVRRLKWSDEISLQEIDVRNNTAAGTPAATFTNLTDAVANQVAVFSGANATRADNDEVYLSFKLADSAGNIDEFARMTAVATDVTSGSEDGQIEFDVIKAGTLTKVWTITSSTGAAMSFDMNVDALTIGSGADTDVSLTFDANSADGVITWMEDEDYFKFSDDILMSTTEKINFHDTAIYIHASTDGQLDLVADTEIQIAATTVDINGAVAFDGALTGITNITLSGTLSDGNYTFDTSGNVSGLGTVGSGAITSSGIIKTDDATEATSTTDGSLQTDGGLSVVKDAVFGDDVFLLSDSSVFNMGAGNDFTITHDGTTGATLAGNPITITAAGASTWSTSSGALTITSAAALNLTPAGGSAILLDGTISVDAGVVTGATSITSTAFVGDITGDVTGNTSGSAATVTTAAQGNITSLGTLTALTVDDVAVNGKVVTMTGSSSDTAVFTAGTNGTLSIVTTDAGGAAANIQITADGTAELAGTTVTLDSAGDIALDATDDVIIPADVGIVFGGSGVGEKIEGDGTDLTVSGNNIKLTPAAAVIQTAGGFFLNETANGDSTTAITINQGAADDQVLAFKSSDQAHAMTGTAEADTYGAFSKRAATQGGLHIEGFSEAERGINLTAYLGSVTTTQNSVNSEAGVNVRVTMTDGSTGVQYPTASANLFGVSRYDGSSTQVIFIVDEDGDLFADGSATTVYDAYDDTALVRAVDLTMNPEKVIRNQWDSFVRYNEKDLVEARLLGDTIENGGLVNVTGMQRLHNGAISQLREDMMNLVRVLSPDQHAMLPESTRSRLALGGA